MTTNASERDSIWRLRLDLASAKALILVGSSPSEADIDPNVHLFFYDRYWRLASLHEKAGRTQRAAALRVRAEYHFKFCRGGGPPHEAAMAARAPRPSIRTLAFGRDARDNPDDAA
jgi:hypothetical protein